MIIEKGKTYKVSNMYKKSFIEFNYYKNDDGRMFTREIGWRGGSMMITPVYSWEVEELQAALDAGEDFEETILLTDFTENEFNDTWDGCWEDYDTHQKEWSEALSEMHDAYYDDEELMDEYFDFGSYMEEVHGYDLYESEWMVSGPIMVEESEYQMDVDMEFYEKDEENANA